jgi:hypothetical protein
VGTTLATKLSTGVKLSLGTETVVSAGVGAEVETKTELKNELELGMSVTTKGNFNTSGEVCLTANETISTSGDGVLQGEDADVFVGGALNLLFGITDDLRFDTNACDYYIKPDLVVFPDKFASTFLYSGYQIKKGGHSQSGVCRRYSFSQSVARYPSAEPRSESGGSFREKSDI